MLQDVPNEKQKERSGMFGLQHMLLQQSSTLLCHLSKLVRGIFLACCLGAKSKQISHASKEDADFIGPYADIRVSFLHI